MKDPEPIEVRRGFYSSPRRLSKTQKLSGSSALLRWDGAFLRSVRDRRDRTHDQMVQGARSGAQNIAEGSKASATSKKTELKLTNVARASLEELRLDYEDYLRQRRLRQWPREDPRRDELIARRCATSDTVAEWVQEVHDRPSATSTQSTYPEIAANAALVLIAVACSLLDRQLVALGKAFVEH